MFWGSLVLVTYLSLRPMPEGQLLFPHFDKLLHAGAYCYFYSTGWLGFGVHARPWRWPLVVGLVAYGIAIEWLQGLGGYREAELLDLAANITGLCLGLLAVVLYSRYRNRRVR